MKLLIALVLLGVSAPALAADVWNSGETHFYVRRDLAQLRAISGVSMCKDDEAQVVATSGATTYFYKVSATGNNSGTTAEVTSGSEYIYVCPNDLAAGGTGTGGISMWQLSPLAGDTIWGRTFVIGGRTVRNTQVDQWNNVTNGATTFYWNGVTLPVQTVLNQLDALAALSPYARPNTNVTFLNTNLATVTADKVLSGASLGARSHLATGVSVAGSGAVVINHDISTSGIYGLHPISGTTVQYVMFMAGAAGGGITVYPSSIPNEPMFGMAGSTRKSGTSYWALPPGNPFDSATFIAVRTGATTYWHVQASSNWVAGN